MVLLILALIALPLLFGYSFFANNISMNKKHALICKRILLSALILGVAMCAVSAMLVFVSAGRIGDSTVRAVVLDSYILFVSVDLGFVGFCILATVIAYFMKSPLSPSIPVLLPMWGILSLCWTWICAVWSDFEAFDASLPVIIFGIGASLLLSLTAYIQACARYEILSSEEKRDLLRGQKEAKRLAAKEKRETRKRIAEKRRRLANPKRANKQKR